MRQAIHLKRKDTILFIGDSITAADRHRQAYSPLGFGYVHFAGNLLLARNPALNLNIVNTGISGDTVIDLKDRWQRGGPRTPCTPTFGHAPGSRSNGSMQPAFDLEPSAKNFFVL